MQIVGVGFDDPSDMAAWAAEEGFQYEVWTDDDHDLAVYYGAVSSSAASTPSRVTMLLDAEGTLLLEYTEDVDFGTHPGEVLEDCQIIFGQ